MANASVTAQMKEPEMQITSDGARLLRPRAAAQYLGCGATTFWKLGREGKLPEPIMVTPHMKAWDVADLDQFIATQKAAAVGEPVIAESEDEGDAAYA